MAEQLPPVVDVKALAPEWHHLPVSAHGLHVGERSAAAMDRTPAHNRAGVGLERDDRGRACAGEGKARRTRSGAEVEHCPLHDTPPVWAPAKQLPGRDELARGLEASCRGFDVVIEVGIPNEPRPRRIILELEDRLLRRHDAAPGDPAGGTVRRAPSSNRRHTTNSA